jgi:hypothetical protein
MKKFIAVDKLALEVYDFDTAEQLMLFLWGKKVDNYIIVKDENRIVKLVDYEIRKIQRQLGIS